MTEAKRPLKVFLSYASQDKPLVRELSRLLVGEGWIDTWQDEKNLLPGQDWRVKIEEAVEEADVVIIVLSQHSVSKEGHVQKELRYAREIALEKPEDAIFLIPLRLDECEVPRGLRFYQWVDYFADKKEPSYKGLVASLKLRYEQKLKAEKEERLRKEQQERDAAVQAARDKAEKEAEERRRIAREKSERRDAERKQKEKELRKASESPISAEFEGKEIKQGIWKSIKDIKLIYWFVVFVALGIFGVVLFNSLNRPSQLLEETPVVTVTLAATVEPSETPKPTLIPTSTLSPTPLPTEIADAQGVPMVLVPSGEFEMGYSATVALEFCYRFQKLPWAPPCYVEDYYREEPAHIVDLDSYYIDVYEVSNEEYKKCVLAGVCDAPSSNSANKYDDYYVDENFNNYPVVYVTWERAKEYCEWRGARLPTEAEWEKAARGVYARSYPWGDFSPAYELVDPKFYENRANIYLGNINKPTVPVNINSAGASPYGVYNMAGNVAEWVSDWYSEKYYASSPSFNPQGPVSGNYKVIRGGSVNNYEVRTTARDFEWPREDKPYIGVRCAMDSP